MARSMVSTSGARQGHFSPTVAQVFAIDAEPSAKARMLREWYRGPWPHCRLIPPYGSRAC